VISIAQSFVPPEVQDPILMQNFLALWIGSGPQATMLTAATFDQPKNAAQKYLDDPAFGVPEVAALMAEIFSNNLDCGS
jgi:hypothetical protein